MSISRTGGEIFAIIAGALVLIEVFFHPVSFAWTLNLILGFLLIFGGIIGFFSHKIGGFLVLLVAICSVVFGLIYFFTNWEQFMQFSLFSGFLEITAPGYNLFYGISIEALFGAIGGGILAKSE